jgi:hypothetical protein
LEKNLEKYFNFLGKVRIRGISWFFREQSFGNFGSWGK